MHINNGSVLVDGIISYNWASILFWRTFLAITAHFLALFITFSMALKLGIFLETYVDPKMEEVLERPPEDTTTMFSFIRQMFYHKTLAYTLHEKQTIEKGRRKCC